MNTFNGKEKAALLDERIVRFLSENHPAGELAIILIGENPASERYIQIKKRYCETKGIKCGIYRIDSRLKDEDIFKKVTSILSSPDTSGGIIQLPLPRPSLEVSLRLIPAEKDVDAISPFSMNAFYSDKPHKILPVVRAFDLFLNETGRNISDPSDAGIKNPGIKSSGRAVVIGEGYLVGKPISHLLRYKNFSVQVLNDYHPGQKIEADLLVLSAGIPNLIKGEDISSGCDVVDFGSSVVNEKTVGDLDMSSTIDHLGLVSTSPGGMGPLVVRFLIMNFLGI